MEQIIVCVCSDNATRGVLNVVESRCSLKTTYLSNENLGVLHDWFSSLLHVSLQMLEKNIYYAVNSVHD